MPRARGPAVHPAQTRLLVVAHGRLGVDNALRLMLRLFRVSLQFVHYHCLCRIRCLGLPMLRGKMGKRRGEGAATPEKNHRT